MPSSTNSVLAIFFVVVAGGLASAVYIHSSTASLGKPVNLYFYTARHSIQDQVKPNWCGSMLNKVVRVIFLCIVTSYFYIGCSFTELKKMHCKFLNPKTHWYLSIFKTFFVCAWKDVAWARWDACTIPFSLQTPVLYFLCTGETVNCWENILWNFSFGKRWRKMQPSPIERNMADSLPSHLLMQLVTYQTACNIWSGSSWNSDIWFCCLLPIMESFI